MRTEALHTITAPQPPSENADGPSAVIRKLGFANATTNPSNQLMVLRSSRSSITAVAIRTSRQTVDGWEESARKQDWTQGVKRIFFHAPDGTCVEPHIWIVGLPSHLPMKEDARMGLPSITLRCDCGQEGRSGYDELWTCPKCSRVY